MIQVNWGHVQTCKQTEKQNILLISSSIKTQKTTMQIHKIWVLNGVIDAKYFWNPKLIVIANFYYFSQSFAAFI